MASSTKEKSSRKLDTLFSSEMFGKTLEMLSTLTDEQIKQSGSNSPKVWVALPYILIWFLFAVWGSNIFFCDICSCMPQLFLCLLLVSNSYIQKKKKDSICNYISFTFIMSPGQCCLLNKVKLPWLNFISFFYFNIDLFFCFLSKKEAKINKIAVLIPKCHLVEQKF